MSSVLPPEGIEPRSFRRSLMAWYRRHARKLPWRGIDDPYCTWVSEIMLQQTHVAAAIDHYHRFLKRFPNLQALAAATEPDVLAAWSGLGYYRRARMLHKAAAYVVTELDGTMPRTAAELLKLPGVGAYTSAAIASIAFGESVAVVDGNVERVLLRLTGRAEEKTAAARAFIFHQAERLTPARRRGSNAPGDHNQAMMELGATLCLPRAPLCLQCPVMAQCQTRGEHRTLGRAPATRRRAAYLLAHLKGQILLERRDREASLMAGMYELPALPLDALEGRNAILLLRHSITNTLYTVSIYRDEGLLEEVPSDSGSREWVSLARVLALPLTGLTRKVLSRLGLLPVPVEG